MKAFTEYLLSHRYEPGSFSSFNVYYTLTHTLQYYDPSKLSYLHNTDAIFIKLSDVLPITVSHQSDEENNQAPFNMEYTGPADPNEPCAFLAKFLVDLRKTTISLM